MAYVYNDNNIEYINIDNSVFKFCKSTIYKYKNVIKCGHYYKIIHVDFK